MKSSTGYLVRSRRGLNEAEPDTDGGERDPGQVGGGARLRAPHDPPEAVDLAEEAPGALAPCAKRLAGAPAGAPVRSGSTAASRARAAPGPRTGSLRAGGSQASSAGPGAPSRKVRQERLRLLSVMGLAGREPQAHGRARGRGRALRLPRVGHRPAPRSASPRRRSSRPGSQ